jgi:hypothetical protein
VQESLDQIHLGGADVWVKPERSSVFDAGRARRVSGRLGRAQARETTSTKDVPGGREENARAPGLAPDMLIAGAGLCPVVVPSIECFVVYHQFAVKQIQFFDAGMSMRRIRSSRCESHEHADTVFFCVRREQFEEPRSAGAPAPRRAGSAATRRR